LCDEIKKDKYFCHVCNSCNLDVVSIAGISESSTAKTKMYEITITNLTSGQPITSPLLVTHSENTGFFTVGETASNGIKHPSENKNLELLVEILYGKAGILDIVQGTAPLVQVNDPGNTDFGHSETFVVSAKEDARYLSFASMLVCTNGGFTGIDSVRPTISAKSSVFICSSIICHSMNCFLIIKWASVPGNNLNIIRQRWNRYKKT
jgi:hypothetical protein